MTDTLETVQARLAVVAYKEHRGAPVPPAGTTVTIVRAGQDPQTAVVAMARVNNSEKVQQPRLGEPVWASEDERQLFELAPKYRRGNVRLENVQRLLVRFLVPPTDLWWSVPYPSQVSWPGKATKLPSTTSVIYGVARVPGGWRWACPKCWGRGLFTTAAGVCGSQSAAEQAFVAHTCPTPRPA
jgi:hypothetical protein